MRTHMARENCIWLTKAWHRNAHSACLCTCWATWIRYIHCFRYFINCPWSLATGGVRDRLL